MKRHGRKCWDRPAFGPGEACRDGVGIEAVAVGGASIHPPTAAPRSRPSADDRALNSPCEAIGSKALGGIADRDPALTPLPRTACPPRHRRAARALAAGGIGGAAKCARSGPARRVR